jgi:hypothetical protein
MLVAIFTPYCRCSFCGPSPQLLDSCRSPVYWSSNKNITFSWTIFFASVVSSDYGAALDLIESTAQWIFNHANFNCVRHWSQVVQCTLKTNPSFLHVLCAETVQRCMKHFHMRVCFDLLARQVQICSVQWINRPRRPVQPNRMLGIYIVLQAIIRIPRWLLTIIIRRAIDAADGVPDDKRSTLFAGF